MVSLQKACESIQQALISTIKTVFMKKYFFLLIISLLYARYNNSQAQSACGMQLRADSACFLPVTLRVVAEDFGLYQIEWYKDGNLIQTYTKTWDTSGEGVLVAGGNGRGPALSQVRPGGLHVDDSSIIYVADIFYNNNIQNHRIFKWYQRDSIGTIIADGFNAPTASKFRPGDFDFDKNMDMHIVDKINNRVIKWSIGATSGTNYAGISGSPGPALNQLDNPNGVSFDTTSGNLYIADAWNDRILQWPLNATSGNLLADNLTGNIQYVDVDLEGNVYISDFNNNRILMFAPGSNSGITVAGSSIGTGGDADTLLRYPEGVIVDGLKNIYVSDYFNHRVQMWPGGLGKGITIGGGNGQGPALNQLNLPNSITQDKWGNVFVGDLNNNRVLKYSPSSIPDSLIATENGEYTVIAKAFNGCILIDTFLVSPEIDPAEISISNFTLSTTLTYAQYQWMLDGEPIPGATSQTYDVVANGDYTVAVEDANGCKDTSDIYRVENINVIEVPDWANSVVIYPNPTHDLITIQSPKAVHVILTDIYGKTIQVVKNTSQVSLAALSPGMYLLRITDGSGNPVKVAPVVKVE